EDQVVHVGEPIRLTNRDPFEHKSRVSNIKADGTPSKIVLNDHLDKPGESYTFTVNQPGTYELRCMIHDGMTATIKVIQ
ncbi:MAG: plastocyanin/azurin family copper-binding protein, partial [Mariprofundales bacterium]